MYLIFYPEVEVIAERNYYRRTPLRRRNSTRRNNLAGCHWPLLASLIKVSPKRARICRIEFGPGRRLVLPLLRRGIERLPASGDGEIGTLAADNRLQIAKLFVIHLRLRRCQPSSQSHRASSTACGGGGAKGTTPNLCTYVRRTEGERKREFHSKKHLHKFSRANKF
jgi:hypothetical protein